MNVSVSPPSAAAVQPVAETALERFEELASRRRAARHFRPDPAPRELLDRLLRIAQRAPNAYNLQPVRFVVVEDRTLRPALRRACMDQPQVEEAPAVVVFLGDRRAFENKSGRVVEQDLAAGAVTPQYAAMLRRNVPLMFGRGPAGLGWLWRALLVPLVRVFRPVPEIPAVYRRFWLAKQVSLSAMNFMLAAEAAGLNTIPLEGFDTGRLRRALGLPRSLEPVLVVPVGMAQPDCAPLKTRLPLEEIRAWI